MPDYRKFVYGPGEVQENKSAAERREDLNRRKPEIERWVNDLVEQGKI